MRKEMRQKPAVYLLVILPILWLGGMSLIVGLISIYSEFKGVSRSAIPKLNALLISLPAFFWWIPISLLLANFILHGITPLRRIADQYASEADRPGFAESQRALLKLALFFTLLCVPLILLGFVL